MIGMARVSQGNLCYQCDLMMMMILERGREKGECCNDIKIYLKYYINQLKYRFLAIKTLFK